MIANDNNRPYRRDILFESEYCELVLITWPPGAKSLAHDHGDSSGRITVICGKVYQKIFSKEYQTPIGSSHHEAGDVIMETPETIHIMGNPSPDTEAKTLHCYTPPLKMSLYPNLK